jgi:hypothetical protein
MMMNWKGFGRKQSWPNFKVLSQSLHGGTDENHEKTQSGQLSLELIFDPETSRIQSRSVIHRPQCSVYKDVDISNPLW